MQSPTQELIPDHVIEEIRLKLPAKSRIRFRCLSKSWCDVINDPSFVRTHLQHNKTNPFVVATQIRNYKKKLIIDWNPDHSAVFMERDCYMYNNGYFDVVGYCDGILCITTQLETTKEESEIIFWNPTIKTKHKTLIAPTHGDTTYGYAFGYDSSIDDYKIVQLTRAPRRASVGIVKVSAMKSNQWRRVYDFPSSWSFFEDSLAVSLNGALYWHSAIGFKEAIIRFDLGNETFSEVPFPVGFTQLELLSELQGKLCCITISSSDPLFPRDIFVLKYESWVKSFTISPYITHGGCFVGDKAVLCGNYFGTFYIDDMRLRHNQNLSIRIRRWWPLVACAQTLVSP